MKIKSQTWIVLVIFALMVGAVYYLNNKKETEPADTTPTVGVAFVFNESDGIANSIEVKPSTGETIRVARDANNVWALELPIETEADQSSTEAAASQLSALQVISTVDGDPSIFGFDAPGYIITIGFADGETHTLEIGDSTPTNSGYYVRLDKKKMMIVGLSGIDALTQLAFFPPYLNTPTPSPLPPTEAPVPDSSVTPTP
ncbi:MAG: DUF4340 domain-containing protein [Chloroflexi bacterium]|nr:DUF4340 domain-containing protein [Chloroflexota bacterium]